MTTDERLSEYAPLLPVTQRAREFLASRRLADLPDEVFRLGDVLMLCERCNARGDTAGAEVLYALLATFAARADDRAGFWIGAVAYCLGLLASTLGRWDSAAAHLDRALRAASASGAGLQAALASVAYARVLLARGGPGDDLRAERVLADLLAVHGLDTAAGPRTDTGGEPALRYAFRREGDYWTLVRDGRVTRVRSRRGFEYIAELLRRPHEQVYVLDLAGLATPPDTHLRASEVGEHGLRVAANDAAVAGPDRRARAEYRTRWRELACEEEAARHDNDGGRMVQIQRERAMLARELAVGSGRSAMQERARVNVRNCITAALRVIRRHDEALWRHFTNAIKTGTFCCYEPDRRIEWEM
ncbi:MAG: hypothetical protein AB7V27_06845 [Candidatus Binatia bacterium]